MRPDDLAAHVHGPGRSARRWLLAGFALLLVTGLGYLAAHDWWPAMTDLGPQPRALSAWLLRGHGSLAWCVVMLAGIVWQSHVRPSWRAVRRRLHARRLGHPARAAVHSRWRTVSGALLVTAIGALLVTGIALQYGPDDVHAALSLVHWIVGVGLAVIATGHWVLRPRG